VRGRRAARAVKQRLTGRQAGRLASLGHDHDRGHRTYVEQIGPGGELWLRTKPFSVPPSYELAQCLRTFSHMVERLGLGVRAQVLDVGCGPGWLSEYLARCGYWVTGVDISEDMVRVAGERVAAIDAPIAEGMNAYAEFHALPVQEMPWTERFDGAVLFDAMHHFHDELETLQVIRRTLVPGGRVFIHEGVRPPPGSEAEQNLIAEMETYGTLESPFDPDYLEEVLRRAGFVEIQRFAAVDDLFDLSRPKEALRRLERQLRYPDLNTVLARRPLSGNADGAAFQARIAWNGAAERRDGEVVIWLEVTNDGQAFWPSETNFPFPEGTVMVGPYLGQAGPDRVELPRTPLPHGVRPGETVSIAVIVPAEALGAADRVTIDLVREGIAWFGELGTEPVAVPIPR
jgi:SAM-dependent methyltransferase